MNIKRKIIFKDALFLVPFMLIVSIATAGIMFKVGRTPYDIEQMAIKNVRSSNTIDISDYIKLKSEKYSVKYYYGDKNDCVLYADFTYDNRGDNPEAVLELYEARDGFDPGKYSIVWFMGEQYVTYTPSEASGEADNIEKYLSSEVPLMYNLVNSYSWDGMLSAWGIDAGSVSARSLMGVRLFSWDHSDKDIMRDNFVWGIGGNPLEVYSYIRGSQGEYKKAVRK